MNLGKPLSKTKPATPTTPPHRTRREYPLFFRLEGWNGTNAFRSAIGSFQTAGDLILDNPDATFTGSWSTGTSSTDKYGSDTVYAVPSLDPQPPGPVGRRTSGPGALQLYVLVSQGREPAPPGPVAIQDAGDRQRRGQSNPQRWRWRLLDRAAGSLSAPEDPSAEPTSPANPARSPSPTPSAGNTDRPRAPTTAPFLSGGAALLRRNGERRDRCGRGRVLQPSRVHAGPGATQSTSHLRLRIEQPKTRRPGRLQSLRRRPPIPT